MNLRGNRRGIMGGARNKKGSSYKFKFFNENKTLPKNSRKAEMEL